MIGRGNGGFLLSPDDVLRLSSSVSLRFKCTTAAQSTSHFDEIQEMEMEVSHLLMLEFALMYFRGLGIVTLSLIDFSVPVPSEKF